LSVAASIWSRAREYSYQSRRDSRSVGLSFHWRSGSSIRAAKRRSCSYGVPFASLLSTVMLMLCIAQLGPALVLFPAVAWMYWTGENAWGTFPLVWSLVVTALDNVLRPVLIRRGADLPL
jgi:hypothetical protein